MLEAATAALLLNLAAMAFLKASVGRLNRPAMKPRATMLRERLAPVAFYANSRKGTA